MRSLSTDTTGKSPGIWIFKWSIVMFISRAQIRAKRRSSEQYTCHGTAVVAAVMHELSGYFALLWKIERNIFLSLEDSCIENVWEKERKKLFFCCHRSRGTRIFPICNNLYLCVCVTFYWKPLLVMSSIPTAANLCVFFFCFFLYFISCFFSSFLTLSLV